MPFTRRAFGLSAVSLPLLPLLGGPAQAATHSVAIIAMKFTPKTLQIAAGDAVTFLNQDNAPHTATAKDGSFDTGRLAPGQDASITFDAPGEYSYFCRIHPGMKARITVI